MSVLSVLSVRAKYVYKSMVYGFDFTDKLVTTFVSFVSKKLLLCGFLTLELIKLVDFGQEFMLKTGKFTPI